ncbi:MAG: DUF4367 domain-containing protein [Clostridia bacterium]|nr:DUF4367 domain-containing protein [Clostridia bacterium]NLS86032.1 DUF4367 domain-containing protein [Oscillospiraceae bacterium]
MNKSDKYSAYFDRIAEAAVLQEEANIEKNLDKLPEPQYSAEFNKKMSDITASLNKQSVSRFTKKTKIIICFAAIISVFAAMSVTAAANGWTFFGISFNSSPTHTDVSFGGQTQVPEDWQYVYTISSLPAGYVQTEYSSNATLLHIVYSDTNNENAQPLSFMQFKNPIDTLSVDSENSQHYDVEINSNAGKLYIKDGESTLCFSNGDYFFMLIGSFDKNEIINIAKSVKKDI